MFGEAYQGLRMHARSALRTPRYHRSVLDSTRRQAIGDLWSSQPALFAIGRGVVVAAGVVWLVELARER
jgi:hypothetical protein